MKLIHNLIALAFNGLILPSDTTVSKWSDKEFSETSSGAGFLPRLSLMTSNSTKCKAGEFPVNHFALVSGDTHDDLGTETDVLAIAWRPLALSTGGDNIISVHDPADPEFKAIMARADNEQNSECQYGPQFLVWSPIRKQFATVFFGSKSSRREAPAFKGMLQKHVTLKAKKCETKQFTWFTATANACATIHDLPDMAAVLEQLEKFNNPPVNKIEKAAPAATNDR